MWGQFPYRCHVARPARAVLSQSRMVVVAPSPKVASSLRILCLATLAALLSVAGGGWAGARDVEDDEESSAWESSITEEDEDEEAEELEGRAPTDEELRPSVQAAFPQESYAPGAVARLAFFNAA